VQRLNEEFEREFWSGKSLQELFASAQQNAKSSGPMERIFASGMREYQKLRERRITDSGLLMDGARRAMRASLQREWTRLNPIFHAGVGRLGVTLCGTCLAPFGASCMHSPAWQGTNAASHFGQGRTWHR
jgi:biopolymer transport protein TolQ